ncbi:MAG TPA: hypothetical protein VLB68_06475 [Pyrinomonadaceae bacterium]|nr:hypothetical protein [Pyrinomonadaceae bacterium]
MPYQKLAYWRFQARGLEILGLNNDPDYTMVKPTLKRNGLTWPQATMESIESIEKRYRIHYFPTTLLIGQTAR